MFRVKVHVWAAAVTGGIDWTRRSPNSQITKTVKDNYCSIFVKCYNGLELKNDYFLIKANVTFWTTVELKLCNRFWFFPKYFQCFRNWISVFKWGKESEVWLWERREDWNQTNHKISTQREWKPVRTFKKNWKNFFKRTGFDLLDQTKTKKKRRNAQSWDSNQGSKSHNLIRYISWYRGNGTMYCDTIVTAVYQDFLKTISL